MSASLCLGVPEGTDLQGVVREQRESPRGDRGGRFWAMFPTPTRVFTSGQQGGAGQPLHTTGSGSPLRSDCQAKPGQPGTKSGTLTSKHPVLDPPPSHPESRSQAPSLRPRCIESSLLPQIQDFSISPPPSDPQNSGSRSRLSLLTGPSFCSAASW